MSWRLRHATPKLWGGGGVSPTEPIVILDRTMRIGEKAARQQFAFYLQQWTEELPGDRHVELRNGRNASLVERPSGCDCTWCARSAAASPEEAENLGWWRMGGTGEHILSYVRLTRTGAPVPRAATEQYRVVDRVIREGDRLEVEYTLWSKHFTKAEARKGLVTAVGSWRNGRAKTARRRDPDAYMLRWSARDYSVLMIERIPS